MDGIDFILTYLDGNDIEWQKEKNRYIPIGGSDVNPNRYRNWDNLQYFFRAVEVNAPWVRKIHIVTYGHLPKWLNVNNPKIHIVRHEDYIPEKWLPTFSSRCIDMNLHRIKDLAEHFVYFNDDMFIIKPVKPSDFFVKGLPKDTAIISPAGLKKTKGLNLNLATIIDTAVINGNFSKKSVLKNNIRKWFSFKYGIYNLTSLAMLPYSNFVGFLNFHLPYSYLKQTYYDVWELEKEICEEAVSHKFRNIQDVNHWLFSYWQFATGKFMPRSINFGRCFQIHNRKDAWNAKNAIETSKYKVVCLNDAISNQYEANEIISILNSSLYKKYANKSLFEI